MKILFDNCTPNPIARSLSGHEVTFARHIGWHELKNGELIQRAEDAGFELILSTDRNIKYQQNIAGGKIAILVLGQQNWNLLRPHIQFVVDAVNAAIPGGYAEVDIPHL
jgi:predicted nuclease of predicted toxin-antitoxin system